MGTTTGLGDGERDSERECGGESMTSIRNAACSGRGVSSVRKAPYESMNRHGVSSSKVICLSASHMCMSSDLRVKAEQIGFISELFAYRPR